MADRAASRLAQLKRFGLSLPGTGPKSPWPGHDDVAVQDKTFAYLSAEGGELQLSVKLPVSGRQVLALPGAQPTGYGLGKSGWVTIRFGPDVPFVPETARQWMMESYRVQAPKRLLRALEAEQPWVRAGALPGAPG